MRLRLRGSLAMLALFIDAALDMVLGLVVMFTWHVHVYEVEERQA